MALAAQTMWAGRNAYTCPEPHRGLVHFLRGLEGLRGLF